MHGKDNVKPPVRERAGRDERAAHPLNIRGARGNGVEQVLLRMHSGKLRNCEEVRGGLAKGKITVCAAVVQRDDHTEVQLEVQGPGKDKDRTIRTGEYQTLLGDMNNDGRFDFDDVDRLIKYIDGQTKFSRFYITKSDVNQDGVIDYNDAVELLAVVNRFKEPEYVTYETRCTPEDYEKYYKNKETSEDATLNNVDINSTEPVTEAPTSSETAEETSLESLKFGDINLDGDVTITDAILLNKYLVGSVTLSEASQKNADCDKDGKLTSSDTLVILDYVVGSIDEIK